MCLCHLRRAPSDKTTQQPTLVVDASSSNLEILGAGIRGTIPDLVSSNVHQVCSFTVVVPPRGILRSLANRGYPSWVMLDGSQGFVRLPGERVIHQSSPRISLALSTPSSYPGNNPLSIHCSSGVTYLTNQRVRISTSICTRISPY